MPRQWALTILRTLAGPCTYPCRVTMFLLRCSIAVVVICSTQCERLFYARLASAYATCVTLVPSRFALGNSSTGHAGPGWTRQENPCRRQERLRNHGELGVSQRYDWPTLDRLGGVETGE